MIATLRGFGISSKYSTKSKQVRVIYVETEVQDPTFGVTYKETRTFIVLPYAHFKPLIGKEVELTTAKTEKGTTVVVGIKMATKKGVK